MQELQDADNEYLELAANLRREAFELLQAAPHTNETAEQRGRIYETLRRISKHSRICKEQIEIRSDAISDNLQIILGRQTVESL